jgi:hypothetical protein
VLLHRFQIVDREEPAVGKSLTARRAAALLHLGQHALHESLSVAFCVTRWATSRWSSETVISAK